MKVEKEALKLGIEELERRAAPTIVDYSPDEPLPEPLPPGGGGSGDPAPPEIPDQPGNSDPNRRKIWHENQ